MPDGNNGSPAAQLAGNLADIAASLVQFREANSAGLSDTQFNTLGDLAGRIETLSDQVNVAALDATLAQVQGDVESIVGATQDAQDAVKRIHQIQDVIAIGGAVLALGGAIAGGNISTIASSAQAVVQAVATATGGGGAAARAPAGS
jgi:hypothetical protein